MNRELSKTARALAKCAERVNAEHWRVHSELELSRNIIGSDADKRLALHRDYLATLCASLGTAARAFFHEASTE